MTGPFILVKTTTVAQQMQAQRRLKKQEFVSKEPEMLRCKRRTDGKTPSIFVDVKAWIGTKLIVEAMFAELPGRVLVVWLILRFASRPDDKVVKLWQFL
jgi:hypothetical protein